MLPKPIPVGLNDRSSAVSPPPPPVPPPAPAVNLLTFGNDFGNADWVKWNSTVANAGAANQALMETATNTDHYIEQVVAWPPGTVQNMRWQYDVIGNLGRSFTKCQISDSSFTGGTAANFNATTGLQTSRTLIGTGFTNNGLFTMTDIGGGAYRCTHDFQCPAVPSFHTFILICNPDTVEIYLGDITKGMRIRNVQFGAI